jgi:hypothetical protein
MVYTCVIWTMAVKVLRRERGTLGIIPHNAVIEFPYKYSIGHTTLNYQPAIKNLIAIFHVKFPG